MALTPAERQRRHRAKYPNSTAEVSARYRKAHPDRIKAAAATRYAEKPELGKAAARRWKTNNPERAQMMNRAGLKLRRAIKRGEVIRPTECSQCHRTTVIEAAHLDYSRPLDVIWLCRPCHRAFDDVDPKTAHGGHVRPDSMTAVEAERHEQHKEDDEDDEHGQW